MMPLVTLTTFSILADAQYIWRELVVPQAPLVLRLMTAAVLGGLIGIERQHHGRSAGFRTHLLVALGAALVMLVSLQFSDVFGRATHLPQVQVDPARVAYGVMGGVGFLGAGAILLRGHGVQGLTTAASLWCTAAVGLACGFGLYILAGFTTLVVLFALVVLGRMERWFPSRRTLQATLVVPFGAESAVETLRGRLKTRDVGVSIVGYSRDAKRKVIRATYQINLPSRSNPLEISRLADDIDELISFQIR
jgi:putative Mg2+ transporter-C (MgtC) family protein